MGIIQPTFSLGISMSSIGKTIASLNEAMNDAVTFTTKELNSPTGDLSKLELVLNVLLMHWRRLDQLISQLKPPKSSVERIEQLSKLKEQWLRQISHFDLVVEKIRAGNLFDKNEQLIHLSVLLHKPYIECNLDLQLDSI